MTRNQPVDYVVVGADVDQPGYWLHPDGTIADHDGPDAVPLTVEYIGRLMVRLSKAGPGGIDAQALQRHCEQVRCAMRVVDLPGATGDELTEAQKQAIHEATTVEIRFESRDRTADPDRNHRILVVPSDRTLEIREAQYAAREGETGFVPPLTYDLDEALMLAAVQGQIRAMIAKFAETAPAGWSAALQAALEAHVAREIAARTTFTDAAGLPEDGPRNAILSSPVRAFYRSVGIYATNMCR